MRSPPWLRYLCALLALATTSEAATAQWTAIRLQPQGSIGSFAYAVWQGQQGGGASFSGQIQPVLWQGSASSWSRLSAPGVYGYVYGMDAGEQVGISAESPGGAALWHGAAGTFVDLHPPGTAYSYAYATKGGQQVGIVTPSGGSENYRAALWHGSNAWTNLNPAGAQRSGAQATDGTLQGGWADFPVGNSYVRHAIVWSGSAESARDLTPAGSLASAVLGMCPGQQVGWARPVGMLAEHAAIWSGSAQSALDLHPTGNPGESHLNATIGWAQVGWSHVPGASFPHAGIWFGSASSFIDLQQFLPPGYSDSYAQAVDFYNGQLEIAGYAVNAQGYSEAFLWRGIPAPGTGLILALGALPLAKRRRR